MNIKKQIPIVIYLVISLIHLFAIKYGNHNLALCSKWLLLPSLMMWVAFNDFRIESKKILYLALIFSFFGDALLSLQFINSNFFIFGLLAFFCAHCFYIWLNLNKIGAKFSVSIFVAILPMLAWAIYLLRMAHEKAGGLFIPVCAYSAILCGLYYSAIVAREKLSRTNWAILFYGIVLFIASDSMIAINKFIIKMPFFDFAIMFTYILAQFMIVYAYIRNEKEKSIL